MIRLLLADDHTLVRAGLRALLESLPDVQVVGEAADGQEALRLIEALSPGVALMDITMPDLNGLDALSRATRQFPHTRILILSMHANEAYVHQALRAGAAGYLLKGADRAELEVALRAVARGETYLSPGISKPLVAMLAQGEERKPSAPLEALTSRQREILQLTAEGLATKETAARLGLSVKTVEAHRHQIMKRLGIRDVTGLVRFAVRNGLVAPDR